MAVYNEGSGGGTAPAYAQPDPSGWNQINTLMSIQNQARSRPRTGKKKPTGMLPTGNPGGVGADPYAAVQARLEKQQRDLENAQQASELDALIARLMQERDLGESEFASEGSRLSTQRAFSEGEARRGSALNREIGRRGIAGRGLSASGVRLGFEGRSEADLSRALGNIGTEFSEQRDALARALERMRMETQAGIAEAEAKKKFLV